MKIQIYELLKVRSDNLIGVDEDDFLEVYREKNVEEENLVRPDNSLFLLLCAEP